MIEVGWFEFVLGVEGDSPGYTIMIGQVPAGMGCQAFG